MVTLLLAASVFLLLSGLDLILGIKLSQILAKEMNPFRVMDPTEYVLLILLALFLAIQIFNSIRKKKQKGNASK